VEVARVAAIIIEPVQGEGGFNVAPFEFMRALRTLCDRHGILLIADEIQTGFGRTGKMFACEHSADVNPDILSMAKGIANGFPLGAFTAREPISEAMKPGDHLSTFGGNPISCAAALANIAVIEEEKLVDNAAQRGEQLLARFRYLQEKCPLIGDVRGRGLMIGLELVRDRKSKEPAAAEAKALRASLRERGILVGVGGLLGNVLRIQPPLSITAAECDRVADMLETALGGARPN